MSVLFALLAVAVPAVTGMIVADRGDKAALLIVMSLFGYTALLCLWFINAALPFTPDGDDHLYFDSSLRTFAEFSDWFDLRQFQQTHAQSGYPLLLSWVQQFCGPSLFARKALNLGFFLLLAPLWYLIGKAIGGTRLGFFLAAAMLFCTPLWFYCLFLLKDIVVVFLQSLLLLGLVNVLSGARRARGYAIVMLSTVLVIPFRIFLALMNSAVLFTASLLPGGAAKKIKRPVRILIACAAIAMLLVFDRTSGMKETFGVYDETGGHDFSSLGMRIADQSEARDPKLSNPILFTLDYFVAEVAAFNPQSYRDPDAALIRALTMVPWIYFGLPLFLTGSWTVLFKRRGGFMPQRGYSVEPRDSQTRALAHSPRVYLLLLLGFVAGYAVVSWFTGDTTRWRMPAMPAMTAVAAFAWCTKSSLSRNLLLVVWAVALSIALVAYYSVIK